MASKALPFVLLLLILSIIIELGGGLLLAIGWHARWAALAIFLFVIPVTIIFHPVWVDPAQKWVFWKNVFILGGMLYVMAYGPGPPALGTSCSTLRLVNKANELRVASQIAQRPGGWATLGPEVPRMEGARSPSGRSRAPASMHTRTATVAGRFPRPAAVWPSPASVPIALA